MSKADLFCSATKPCKFFFWTLPDLKTVNIYLTLTDKYLNYRRIQFNDDSKRTPYFF